MRQGFDVRELTRGTYRPRGMSFWGYLWILFGVAVAVTLLLRLAPHYMNFRAVQTVVTSLEGESVVGMSKRQVYETLGKRFKINSLYDLKPHEVIAIERIKGGTTLRVDYEVREPLVYNADIVLSFQDEVVFKRKSES